MKRLWWQRPQLRGAPAPLKGLTDNPAYQWWRDATILQPDSWWGEAQSLDSLAAQAALLRDLGASMFRFEVPWRMVAPTRPGAAAYDGRKAADPDWPGYRFERMDLIIDVLDAASIAALPVVVYAPRWAIDEHADSPAAPPSEPEFFADLMTALTRRYRGRVTHWELWNEPDHPHSWSGTMGDYCRLVLDPGSAAVRAVAPECGVLIGGLADYRNLDSIGLNSLGSFDIVSIHHYPASPSARHARLAVNHVRRALQSRGQRAKPVWLTECGIATEPPSSPSDFGGVTDEAGQARLVRSLFDSVQADAVFIYQLHDTSIFGADGRQLKQVHWGLLNHDGSRRKQGFDAYRRASTRHRAHASEPAPRTVSGRQVEHRWRPSSKG